MMYDDLNTRDESAASETGYQPRPRPVSPRAPQQSLPDREVPVPGNAPSLVHQWLDGDVSTAVMRATLGGNETADLWSRINDEAETLRSRTTPLYVHKRIMDSLPNDTHRARNPWYRRSLSVQPAVMLAGAAALVGVGAVVARLVFR